MRGWCIQSRSISYFCHADLVIVNTIKARRHFHAVCMLFSKYIRCLNVMSRVPYLRILNGSRDDNAKSATERTFYGLSICR